MATNEKKTETILWRSAETHPSLVASQPPVVKTDEDIQEFAPAVRELIERGIGTNINRKGFLTLMGASLAMAGINCAKEPVEKIVPYVTRPPETIPGVPVFYATARVSSEGVSPLLVKTREGKPIKIEGLSDHPVTGGALFADDFATIWDLYDPDRLRQPMMKNGSDFAPATWDQALAKVKEVMKGGKVAILTRPGFSPSEAKALAGLKSATSANVVVYDAIGNQAEILTGEKKSTGSASIPQYRFDKASLILSLEADFLGTWLSPALFTRQFTSGRTPDKKMNRLVAVESNMSLTGANADSRLSITSGTQLEVGLALANVLLKDSAFKGNAAVKSAVEAYTPDAVAKISGISAAEIVKLAGELKANAGKSLVVAGSKGAGSSQGSLQIVSNLLNAMLGNDGKTVLSDSPMKATGDVSEMSELTGVIKGLKEGKITTLIVVNANPVYDLAGNMEVLDAVRKAPNLVVIGSHLNETAAEAHVILPTSHFLESWGDGLSYGVYSIQQPVIRTLFDTRSTGDILMQLAGSKDSFYSAVQKTAASYSRDNFGKLLARGFVAAKSGRGRKFNASSLQGVKGNLSPRSGYLVSLYESVGLGDGSGGNNSYRYELPDPVTKITWENALLISDADATQNKWEMGDILKITSKTGSVEAPAFIQPGIRKGSMALALGFGHEKIGQVGVGKGVNAWKLASFKGEAIQFSGINVIVEKVDDGAVIATTQKHGEMEGRNLARIASLKEFLVNPKAGNEEEELPGKGLYPKHNYEGGYRWAMNVDLNTCTGCSACVVACYSENNIPVVGKKEVSIGREMSWMRIDRYYSGTKENPQVHFQPVMCQHCENAPCENVCPVAATSHSSEGLNDMAYNRCIGTRYCANNCPYKVRRFNWFENWEGRLSDPAQLALNPDVTVRSRGVIEKCSFCVQRINEARQQTKIHDRKITDSDLKTACQQGCPANAITFGDINNTKSAVSEAEKDSRSYKILAAINVKPMVSYRVKIRNEG